MFKRHREAGCYFCADNRFEPFGPSYTDKMELSPRSRLFNRKLYALCVCLAPFLDGFKDVVVFGLRALVL